MQRREFIKLLFGAAVAAAVPIAVAEEEIADLPEEFWAAFYSEVDDMLREERRDSPQMFYYDIVLADEWTAGFSDGWQARAATRIKSKYPECVAARVVPCESMPTHRLQAQFLVA